MRAAGILLFLLAAASAQAPGIAVGARIPAFEAADQNGRTQTFETIRGPKGALLVFYRSADW
jgi:hypothetical protein